LITLILSSVFILIGGGKFSSKVVLVVVYFFEIVLLLVSVSSLVFHLKKNIKKEHYQKYYKVYDLVQFVLLIFLIFFFFQTFVLKTARVSGSSMEETLHDGDLVLVFQAHDNYKYDDIVVMDSKNYPDLDVVTLEPRNNIINDGYYVKRIKGLPGQSIRYEETAQGLNFYVDDVLVQYTDNTYYSAILRHLVDSSDGVIPKGKYLLFGDNYRNSKDSRVFGFVDKKDVLGIVKFRLNKPGTIK
ncbi:MAG: signal peptidase I, partial [Acholeplasmataceae bacterium]|nr:signal peptidase I [Acholeplasmataceae bacterium]